MRPTHLNRYAVVFPGLPDDGAAWVRFWTALDQEARKMQLAPDNELALYYDVCADQRTPDYQALPADVQLQSVAGIVFVTFPRRLVGTPILEQPGIPRVAISTPMKDSAVPFINLDTSSFYHRAVAELQRRGCRRIASLNSPGLEIHTDLTRYAADPTGLVNHAYWNPAGHLLHPETSHGLMQLLFQGSPESRPMASSSAMMTSCSTPHAASWRPASMSRTICKS